VNSIWVGRFLGGRADATSNANIVMFLLIARAFAWLAATILIANTSREQLPRPSACRHQCDLLRRHLGGDGVTGLALCRPLLIACTRPQTPAARGGLHARDLPRAALSVYVCLRGGGAARAGDSKTPFYFMLLSVGIDIALNRCSSSCGSHSEAGYRGLGARDLRRPERESRRAHPHLYRAITSCACTSVSWRC